MSSKKIAIAGALGLAGGAATRHFETRGWEVVGLSRRAPDQAYRDTASKATFLSADLRDSASCERASAVLAGVTHAIYAAVYETADLKSGWTQGADNVVSVNVRMLTTFLDMLERSAPELEHITVLHGTKAYGVHTGPIKLPGKEQDPRVISVGFYDPQEDLLRARQSDKPWSWTILRPQMLCGFATGAPISCLPGIGVYAAICRDMGLPLRFPGRTDGPLEAVDVNLLAKMFEWAASDPRCANQIYNVTNGDVMCWTNVFPRIADEIFGMDYAPPHQDLLSATMADKSGLWDEIVKKYMLARYSMSELVSSWGVVDFFMDYGDRNRLSLVSTIKARKHGFHECEDSEDVIIRQLMDMQARRILPPRR